MKNTYRLVIFTTVIFVFLLIFLSNASPADAVIKMSPKYMPQQETRVTLIFTGVKPNGCYMVRDFYDSWDGVFAHQKDEHLCGINEIKGSVPDGAGNNKREAYIRASSNGVLTLKGICDNMSGRKINCEDTFDAERGGNQAGKDYMVELFEISLDSNKNVTGFKKVGQPFYSFYVMYKRCAYTVDSNIARAGELINITFTQDGNYNVYLGKWDEKFFLENGFVESIKSNGYQGVTEGNPVKFFLPENLNVNGDYLIKANTTTISPCNPRRGTLITITGVVPPDERPPPDEIPDDDIIIEDPTDLPGLPGLEGPGGTIDTPFGPIPTDPQALASIFVNIAIGMAGGVAFLLMVFGSYRLIFAGGNPESIQQGKEIITAAIAGLIVIIFSVFILRLIGLSILGLPI